MAEGGRWWERGDASMVGAAQGLGCCRKGKRWWQEHRKEVARRLAFCTPTLQAEKAEAERQLRKKAFQEDMDRRRKAEEARRETEAILAAQVRGGLLWPGGAQSRSERSNRAAVHGCARAHHPQAGRLRGHG